MPYSDSPKPKIASSFFTPPYRDIDTTYAPYKDDESDSESANSKPVKLVEHASGESTSLLDRPPATGSELNDAELGYGRSSRSRRLLPADLFTRDHVGSHLAEFTGWDSTRSDMLGFWFFVIIAVVVLMVFLVFIIVFVRAVGHFADGEGGLTVDEGWSGRGTRLR
ncbi:hypothetical protein BJ508DRAFT_346262 [Ascobolus immersus RN42]|uniref:Uncharacterized protein n=1 Tax=Ascobolus immersus RN42 TaxID=1160509 RepID=A0A3N4I6I2_ASCIM|nr:hypothetical protein BJ508DRAFT_346262 [Ascobolus immersus RN42]